MPGLEDLYREIILDHYRSPRNRGELAVPPAYKVEGFNPLCGDEVVLYPIRVCWECSHCRAGQQVFDEPGRFESQRSWPLIGGTRWGMSSRPDLSARRWAR